MTIRRVGLIARPQLPAAIETLAEAAAWLAGHGCRAVVDERSAHEAGLAGRFETAPQGLLASAVDAIVTFGGDGTLLDAAGVVAQAGFDTPVIGINLGRLGFLTEASRGDLVATLAALVEGRTSTETRAMLTGRIRRGSQIAAERFALNDIVVTRGALARMIEIDVAVDGQSVCDVKADGLIVATATGSTAYNLSAGGPIVHPGVDAFVLTPIAPHTLTHRPLVLPATVRLVLRPDIDAQSEIVITFDGQSSFKLEPGDVIEIERAPRTVHLLRTSPRTHFDMLREKLQWGKV
jgi:NAD+ kinase